MCQRAGFEVCEIQEENDEIWCILKKIRMGKEESLQDRKDLLVENIEETKQFFQIYKNYPKFLKGSMMRIISNSMPSRLLTSIYERRNKVEG